MTALNRLTPAESRLTSVLGSWLARGLDWLLWLLVGLAALTIALAFAPGLLNRQLLAVTGGSMEPAFSAGDALLTQPVDDPSSEIAPGDVVVVRSPDGSVAQAHRVLQVASDSSGETLFQTRGDANEDADPGWVPVRNVSAKVLTTVPELGNLLSALSQPLARLFLFAVPLGYVGLKLLYAGLFPEEESETS
jgi:signal peptidase